MDVSRGGFFDYRPGPMSSPFDATLALIADLPGPNEAARAAAADALKTLGDTGRLGQLALWAAAWQGRSPPRMHRPIVALYAATHTGSGEAEGATKARLKALADGEGALSAAARTLGAGVEAFDLAIDRPVPDAADQATMSERECAATLAFGMEALAKGPDMLVLGDIASGADRAAGALALALFGGEAAEWSANPEWSARAVARARGAGARTPLDLLRELGGREAAALAGAILAARVQKVPVVLDGYAAWAGGAVLAALRPDAVDHCVAADAGPGPGLAALLARLGKPPLLALGADHGRGLTGVAALAVMGAACALVGEAAT